MITAIVLAAGEATRFGQCKQLIPLGDKTLLEHVLQNVVEVRPLRAGQLGADVAALAEQLVAGGTAFGVDGPAVRQVRGPEGVRAVSGDTRESAGRE